MTDRGPIVTLEEVDALDDAELLDGYHAGRAGEPEPGDNRTKAYWHGWRNGTADGGHRPLDGAQRDLAHAYAERERRKALH